MKKSKAVAFILILNTMLVFTLSAQTVVQWYTNMGDFRVQLREDLVPVTAQNFIDLTNADFYDGLIFHRVIAEFMIQDGDPNGNGTGGPGYTFDDEFHPDLRHDQPGILSMANSGPNTNGSQYFITVVPTAWLDDVHAVFGKVMDGMEVVYAISEVETNANDKPLVDVIIDSIRVVTGNPEIELTAPVSSGKWNNAVENIITWNSSFIADVKIEFSSDNGQNWDVLTDSYSAHYRQFEWELPSVLSEECFIRISDAANPDIVSVNEEAFTICNLNLQSPNGFEIFQVGREVEISWQSDFVNELSFYFQTEEAGDWTLIESGIPATDESYTWTPETAGNWCKIKIEETAFLEVADVSDFRFFVYLLDLVSPHSGELVFDETEYPISWNSEFTSNIKIEFSEDGGNNWVIINNSMPASELSYIWSVPYMASDNCYIKLSAIAAPQVFSMNEFPFIIIQETGIQNLDVSNENLYLIEQNPIYDVLKIKLTDELKAHPIYGVNIYTSNGQLVMGEEGISDSNNGVIDVNLMELTTGIYFLEIVSDIPLKHSKLIKL